MKKLLQSLFLLLFVAVQAMAQVTAERTVTGTVTAKEDGLPLPGVTIKVKGSSAGTASSADGKFSLSVPAGSNTLVFSFMGYRSQEVPITGSTINVVLAQDASMLTEVVVTALGETREKKSLPYSVQQVSEEKLTIAKNYDISTALAGKVAGVQLQGSPSSTFDNANVIIRGVNGLSVGNPLYIVDGTPTDQNNVIMDNVENLSVLKGASAVALYGNRAANGVVIITSKKGTRNNQPTIEFNLGSTFENVSVLPGYQNQYAGGYSSANSTINSYGAGYLDAEGFYIFNYDPSVHPTSWAGFQGQRILEYGADESWGPKIAGQTYRPWTSWYPGSGFGQTTALTAQPDNIKNFFDTGRMLNNSLAFSGGGDNFNYRLIYQNQDRTLVLPNTKLSQNQFGINGSYDISKRIKVSTEIGYTNRYTKGRPQEGYRNDGLNITQGFNQWFQRQINLDELKDYTNADGTLRSWNIGDPNSSGDPSVYLAPQYWDSPYFVAEQNYGVDRIGRLLGNIGVGIKLTDKLTWQSNVRLNTTNSFGDFKIASFGLQQSEYSVRQAKSNETNYESNLSYKTRWSDISLDALAGGNIRSNTYDDVYTQTQGGLSVPNFFDVSASIARPATSRGYTRRQVRSAYGRASLGYKDFLYVDGSLRNDWSSTLPSNDNSYLYPSIGSSFVFSELLNGKIKDVISYGKLRASYAQVGSDLNFNQVNIAMNRGGTLGGGLYGDQASYGVGDQYRSGLIKPALTKSWEVGAEFRLFNKVGIDVAYYQDNNTDQILPLDVTGASGYTSNQINAGNIQRNGVELSLNATPVKSKDFSWDINVNFAKSESVIKELHADLKTYLYGTEPNDTRLEHREGEKWGMIVGRKWKTDANGNTIILSNGQPDYNINQDIGTIVPDFTGGVVNSLNFKGLDLSFSLDFQQGGKFFSRTKMYNYGAGLSEFTVGTNDKGGDIRDYPGAYTLAGGNAGNGGVLIPGVFADGTKNNRYIPARSYYYTALQKDARNFVLDGSYLKLRDVRLGYTIPKKWLSGMKAVKSANLGMIVNNAWLISAPAKKYGIDPSELESIWNEGGQLTSTRQIGLNLRASF